MASGESPFSYRIVSRSNTRNNKRFNTSSYSITYAVKCNGLTSIEALIGVQHELESMFDELLRDLLQPVGSDDIVSVEFLTKSVNHSYDKNYFRYGRKDRFSGRQLLEDIFRLLQSNDRLNLDEDLIELNVTIIHAPQVRGLKRRQISEKSRPGHVLIDNDDDLCGFYAITYSFLSNLSIRDKRVCHVKCPLVQILAAPEDEGEKSGRFRSLCLQRGKVQPLLEMRTRELFHDHLGMSTDEPLTLSLLPDIAEALGVRIYVIEQERMIVGKKKLFRELPPPLIYGHSNSNLNLYLELCRHGDSLHMNVIKKLSTYFNCKVFCIECWACYSHTHIHDARCKKCGDDMCDSMFIDYNYSITCDYCCLTFESEDCYKRHKQESSGEFFCALTMKCNKCSSTITNTNHICHGKKCNSCSETFDSSPHFCYLRPLSLKWLKQVDLQTKVFVAFDIETFLDDNCHRANLLVALYSCDSCSLESLNGSCKICRNELRTYAGHECVSLFINDLLTYATRIRGQIICYAHNFRGYDGRFIIREIWTRGLLHVSLIMTGSKIMLLKFANIRFIDTHLLMPQPLAALPRAFDFEHLVKKGWFPYLLNTNANENYAGNFPTQDLFGDKVQDDSTFITWYESERQKYMPVTSIPYVMCEHLIEYCKDDVRVLANALSRFRQTIKSITGIDSVTRRFTIASIALETFRAAHLSDERDIGLTPVKGYINMMASAAGNAWLDCLDVPLIREKILTIGNTFFYVDGYDEVNKCVYEFYGCWHHACPRCFPRNRSQFIRTIEREKLIRNAGFGLVTCWSCDNQERMKGDENYRHRYEQRLNLHKQLRKTGVHNLQSSLFGGRVENMRAVYICEADERIRYLDFTSLYPFVLKYRQFPRGHPQVILDQTYTQSSHYGFVVCKILPPTDLLIPVLPKRIDGKLLFALCNACATSKNKADCVHSPDERCLEGIFTTVEVDKALEKGYEILQTYAIYHYSESFSAPFRGYVDAFLKVKQEASGFPPEVETEEAKDAYIVRYAEKEGIKLDKTKMKKNSSLRSIAKLFLNSIWGKLAEERRKPKTVIVNSAQELWAYSTNCEIDIKFWVEVNDDTYLVNYLSKMDEEESPGTTSYAVASYVTSWARLKLYELMEQIESVRPGRVLYVDTDSVIFVEKNDDPPTDTGDFLGELTDELDQKCSAGLFLGAKSYILRVGEGDRQVDMIKCKGLVMSRETKKMLTFERVSELLQGENRTLSVPQTLFRTDRNTQQIRTVQFSKLLRVTSDKRVIKFDGLSIPYGFINHASSSQQDPSSSM